MEDLTEMFTLPTWPEANMMNKLPWDYHGGGLVNAMGQSHYATHQGMLAAAHGKTLPSDVKNGNLISRGMQEAAAFEALRRLQEGSCRATDLRTSIALASSSSCDMAPAIDELPASTPTWPQPYLEGMSSPTLGLGPDGPHNSSHLCGRRSKIDNAHGGPNHESVFVPVCGGPQAQQLRATSQQVPHGLSATPYASHTGLGQPQGAAAVVAGTARPRVRARRGQATDPHSIAERLRRERIADRMKALQELVPNVNKTDKALMLDEIIEYVRFLQLQVKILSMSRLSGTSAMVPLVADIPSEGLFDFAATALLKEGSVECSSQDNIITTEQQVAKLMEESMGSALQFLQSKGLCLMPVSLATAMSSCNTRSLTSSSHGKAETSPTSIRPCSNVVIPMTSLHGTGHDLVANEVSSGIRSSSRETLTQPIVAHWQHHSKVNSSH